MKQLFALLPILLMLAFSACSNDEPPTYTDPPPQTEVTTHSYLEDVQAQPLEMVYISPQLHPINHAAEERYLHNRNLYAARDYAGFIYGQNHPSIRDIRIGASGNMANHGCGPAAVYNVLRYLYQNHTAVQPAAPHIASIIRYLDYNGGINLNGLAGTHPEVLTAYLQHAGHNAALIFEPAELDTRVQDATVSILLYGRIQGGAFVHYVKIRYEAEQFWVYNEFGNDTQPRVYDSLDAWVAERGYRMVAVISIQ